MPLGSGGFGRQVVTDITLKVQYAVFAGCKLGARWVKTKAEARRAGAGARQARQVSLGAFALRLPYCIWCPNTVRLLHHPVLHNILANGEQRHEILVEPTYFRSDDVRRRFGGIGCLPLLPTSQTLLLFSRPLLHLVALLVGFQASSRGPWPRVPDLSPNTNTNYRPLPQGVS